jgi:uncharacterized Rmd1/YagE family protein
MMNTVSVKAYDLASGFDLGRAREILERTTLCKVLDQDPLLLQFEDQKILIVFSYGATVFFNIPQEETRTFIQHLRPSAIREYDQGREDDFLLHITSEEKQPEGTSKWYIREFNRDIALVVGVVLSRSVSLEHYETRVGGVLEQFQQTIAKLATTGWIPHRRKEAAKHVGFALSVEHELAYDVAILDDPDILWDGGARVGELYAKLKREFDLEDRIKIVMQKVSIISRFSTFVLSRLESQRAMFLEWIIIILILSEIVFAFIKW